MNEITLKTFLDVILNKNKTNHRYRARTPFGDQYTASNEGITKPTRTSYYFDKVWSFAPDGRLAIQQNEFNMKLKNIFYVLFYFHYFIFVIYTFSFSGICGNCNGQHDDYRTKHGQDVSRDQKKYNLIGQSWEVLDDSGFNQWVFNC